jgi:hypothetical protein
VPSEACYDIRRHRQHPWRCLARRIREARAQSVPIDHVRELVRVLDRYILEVYQSDGVPQRAA